MGFIFVENLDTDTCLVISSPSYTSKRDLDILTLKWYDSCSEYKNATVKLSGPGDGKNIHWEDMCYSAGGVISYFSLGR